MEEYYNDDVLIICKGVDIRQKGWQLVFDVYAEDVFIASLSCTRFSRLSIAYRGRKIEITVFSGKVEMDEVNADDSFNNDHQFRINVLKHSTFVLPSCGNYFNHLKTTIRTYNTATLIVRHDYFDRSLVEIEMFEHSTAKITDSAGYIILHDVADATIDGYSSFTYAIVDKTAELSVGDRTYLTEYKDIKSVVRPILKKYVFGGKKE